MSPTFRTRSLYPKHFPAKEELQDMTTFRHDKKLPEHEMIGVNTNPSLGNLETIWNSMAAYRPMNEQVEQELLYINREEITVPVIGRFLKGWNIEWGSVQVQSSHARTGTLFGRLCLCCCSNHGLIRNLALWAAHSVLRYKAYPSFWGVYYKVYPGFWGRQCYEVYYKVYPGFWGRYRSIGMFLNISTQLRFDRGDGE
jgi:hypothetical protein